MVDMNSPVHRPVMLEELLEFAAIAKDGVYLDMTVGAAGHTRAVLERLSGGFLVGLDRDEEILAFAEAHLKGWEGRYSLHRECFSQAPAVLKKLGIKKVNGVWFDLGVSSLQFDRSHRGFSLTREGPLDMRMGASDLTAEKIIATYDEQRLADLFHEYGEEPRARRIAHAIVQERKKRAIRSTLDLAALVAEASGYSYGRTHPATRVFQALRIEVNDELGELNRALSAILPFLAPNARLIVVSFHSLEDRTAKLFFRENDSVLETLTPKPVEPCIRERKTNPRSRSAKLRCARKR